MPNGYRAYASTVMGGLQTNEAIYDRLDEDATNRALTTDDRTCPRCEFALQFEREYKHCISCGWMQEYDRPNGLEAKEFKPRRGFIDYPYAGQDKEFYDTVLQEVIEHKANGFVRIIRKCPDFGTAQRISRCGRPMKRIKNQGMKGRVYLRCSMDHNIILFPEPSVWAFPWDAPRP